MTVAVVFGLAVGDGLEPVAGAAPCEVLARQVPRQLVQLLNAGGDRGVRFLPFLGHTNGQRGFLRVPDLLPVATLAALHRRTDVQFLVDGALAGDRLRVRVHGSPGGQLLLDRELPFQPQRPFDVLPRLQFEIMTALGLSGRPVAAPALAGPTLAWFLIAKDELLALEAGLPVDPDADLLRAARHCAAAAAAVADVQEVVVATAAYMLRGGGRRDDVGALLRLLLDHATPADPLLRRIGGLLQTCGDERAAAAVWTRVANADPRASEAVETAAALWFRLGEPRAAHEVLARAHAAGGLAVGGMGQLAAVADRLGDRDLRDRLTGELLTRGPLPAAVARLCVSFLFETGRVDEAQQAVRGALSREPQDVGLWLDLGRCGLLRDDVEGATAALRRARELGGSSEQRRDAGRLLRLVAAPGLFAAMQQADAAFLRGDRPAALRRARAAVRRLPSSGEAWLFLGVVRHKFGHARRAEQALRRALALDDELAEAHNRLGILLVAAGEVEPGFAHLQRAAALAPDDSSAQVHLAQACALLGRRDDGERHLQAATRLGAHAETVAAVRRQFFAAG